MYDEDLRWILAPDEKMIRIKKYPHYYITNYGHLFSKLPDKKNFRLLKCIWNGKHMVAHLTLEEKDEFPLLHRLVAEAFLPNPKNLPYVKHIDGNMRNNKVSNLIWSHTARDDDKYSSLRSLTLPGEEFKPILLECKETEYLVSTHGRVLRGIPGKDKYMVLYQSINANKQLYVRLQANGRCYYRQVNKLVAEAFLPKPDRSYRYICYKDDDPMNLHIDNLYWTAKLHKSKYY